MTNGGSAARIRAHAGSGWHDRRGDKSFKPRLLRAWVRVGTQQMSVLAGGPKIFQPAKAL